MANNYIVTKTKQQQTKHSRLYANDTELVLEQYYLERGREVKSDI